jgi:NTE family protein
VSGFPAAAGTSEFISSDTRTSIPYVIGGEVMKNKLGIALGSGGARGLAHIGVLEELAEMEIYPDLVAGTSMGSVVGAGYCTGHLQEMKDLALSMDVRTMIFRFMEFSLPHSGLVEGKRINELIEKLMPLATFESLQKPLRCVATNLKTGEEVVFSKGKLQPAIRASISIPGVFTPAEMEGQYLIDGGLVNPIPVNQVREMGAVLILAVDVNHGCLQDRKPVEKSTSSRSRTLKGPLGDLLRKLEETYKENEPRKMEKIRDWFKSDRRPNLVDVLGDTIHIVENQVGKIRLKIDKPDILLTPEVGDIDIFDFHHAEEIIEAGRASVRTHADEIRELCASN